jgi:hypothetical protein
MHARQCADQIAEFVIRNSKAAKRSTEGPYDLFPDYSNGTDFFDFALRTAASTISCPIRLILSETGPSSANSFSRQ